MGNPLFSKARPHNAGCLYSNGSCRCRYAIGANVICEGDEGDSFYIIREGEVKCTKVGPM